MRSSHGYAEKKPIRKDIFGDLPLELSQRIAEYMDLPNSIRSRRVSKKWLNILGCAQTSQLLLQPWLGVGGSKLHISKGLSPTALSSLKAEQICSYRTGSAFDRSIIEAPLPSNGPISNHIAYSSGRVAWIDPGTYIIHLLTLEPDGAHSRQKTRKIKDEALSHIALSNSVMVAATLSGQCRVRKLTTRKEHRFQLDNTNILSLVAANDTVAILYSPLDDQLQVKLTTWTLRGCKVVHFSAGLHRSVQTLGSCDLKIMLDASGARVVMFERVVEAKLVYFTRFSLDGLVQTEGTLELPSLEGYAKHSEASTPNHTDDWATIWSYSKIFQESGNYPLATKEVLRVQCHPEREFVLRLKKDTYNFYPDLDWPMSNIFFWNNIAYSQAGVGPRMTVLDVVDFSTGFNDVAAMGRGIEHETWDLWQDECDQWLYSGGMAQSVFFGDERFLVNACQYGFIVWAFDKGHGLTEIDAIYREDRKKATVDRNGPWRNWDHLFKRL